MIQQAINDLKQITASMSKQGKSKQQIKLVVKAYLEQLDNKIDKKCLH
jgi:hypothetical protein